MNIFFYYEWGKIKEIGTGHKYRSNNIAAELKKRGHDAWTVEENNNWANADIVVVDHIYTQNKLINNIKLENKKIVLIDGAEEDVSLVDLSISAIYNKKSEYTGMKYIVLPKLTANYYSAYNTSDKVFVGLGGYDGNGYTKEVIKTIAGLGLKVLLAKNINDIGIDNENVIQSEDGDYYSAMKECVIGVVGGGLTLFQALRMGLPVVAIPQYNHQKDNIRFVEHCCVPANVNDELGNKIKWLVDSLDYRRDVSRLSRNFVDGNGLNRVCDLIEEL